MNLYKNLLLVIYIHVCYYTLVISQGERCFTPLRQIGYCRPLNQCYSLLKLFSYNRSRSTINLLIQAQQNCGSRHYRGDPILCCTDIVSRTVPETTVIPITEAPVTQPPPPPPQPQPQPIPVPEGRQIRNCLGPDSQPGTCISLRECPPLLDLYASRRGDRQLISFIQESNRICNYEDAVVCCPSLPQTQTIPTTASPPPVSSTSARLLTPEEGCGVSNATHNRVVNGVPAKLGAWPWMALLGYDNGFGEISFKCGGSLITTKHVMSAAHCIRNDLKSVRLGEHDLSTNTEAYHQDIQIEKYVTHPQYDRRDGTSDISIILLQNPVQFSQSILPICIPLRDPELTKSYVDYMPFVAGWGKTAEGGNSANVLQEVQLPVLENNVCREKYSAIRRNLSDKQFGDGVLCVGLLSGGKDSCQGDSGGPLMQPHQRFDGETIYYQLGIVSYGVGCARENVPGVYTSVQKFSGWIRQTVDELN